VETGHQESAARARGSIRRGDLGPAAFRSALTAIPPAHRDAWLDVVFELGEPPDDGPELPRGCVPYLPCSVDAILRMVEQAPVSETDVFVDIGSGLGRAAALVHLLTGAPAIGLEIQRELVLGARHLSERLRLPHVVSIEGDAVNPTGAITIGSVFFFYCPFSGARLDSVLGQLEAIARTRMIRVCCLDLPLLSCPWLTLESPPSADLAIYRSSCRSS
jgi:hypothetical protein